MINELLANNKTILDLLGLVTLAIWYLIPIVIFFLSYSTALKMANETHSKFLSITTKVIIISSLAISIWISYDTIFGTGPSSNMGLFALILLISLISTIPTGFIILSNILFIKLK